VITNKLKLKNICQHRDLTIEPSTGLIGIVGPNGAGKTNILRMFEYLLTGKMPGQNQRQMDEFITWGETRGELELDLATNAGTPCEIKRVLGPDSSFCLKIGSEEYTGVNAGYAQLHSLFNASPNMISSIAFLKQGEIDGFLFAENSQRMQEFQRLFRTDAAERCRRLLLEEVESVVINDHLTDLTSLKEEVAADKEKLEDLCIKSQSLDASLSLVEEKLSCFPANMEQQFTEIRMAFSHAKTHAQEVLTNYRTAKERLSALQNSEINVDLETVNALINAFEAQINLTAELRRLDARRSAVLSGINTTSVIASGDPNEVTEQLERLNIHKAHLLYEKEQQRILVEAGKLNGGFDKCPICNFEYPQSSGCCLLCGNKIEAVRMPEPGAIKKIEQDITTTDRDINALVGQVSKIKDAVARVARLKEELAALEQDIADIRPKLTINRGDYDEARKQRDAKTRHDSELAICLASVDMYKGSAAQAQVKLESAKKAFDALDENALAEYNVVKSQQDVLKIQLANQDGQKRQLSASIDSKTRRFRELKKTVEAEQKRQKYTRGLKEARRILHRDNLPAVVARSHKDAINRELAKYLDIFSVDFNSWLDDSKQAVVSFGSQVEAKIANDVLSEGQKTALAISFSVALWALFLPEISFLVLDEPTHHLDKNNIGKLTDLFSLINSYCKECGAQIFVVTHEDSLIDCFDGIISLR